MTLPPWHPENLGRAPAAPAPPRPARRRHAQHLYRARLQRSGNAVRRDGARRGSASANLRHWNSAPCVARTCRFACTPSPEFAMKKAAGRRRGPRSSSSPGLWRNEEGSATHAPEFTMLEWYRPGARWPI
ncbi:MAG: hypothetical protein WDN04_14595 [Rhodospirillales bacterium]